ncbi:MAG: DUF1697 domain-containing protein [Flavobacteriaceae bacterium]|nr:DUF1697 domain-containing protein [Flavobacteriaceae bacterium]
MKTFIALLRGINVSGHKIIPMAELRNALSEAGLLQVQTYIQSGNVIFDSERRSKADLAKLINQTILERFGHDVPVLVIEPQTIEEILNTCPFEHEKKEKSYFTLLYRKPNPDQVKDLEKISYPNEEFVIDGSVIYYYCSTGYGRAKWNNKLIERKLQTNATSRNYRTMTKLLSLCNQRESHD